ncbi:MAG: hypothetical protein ACRC0Y_07805, partial [Fusobacteriaceae bacterium]
MYRSLCGNSSLWRVIQTKVVSNGYKIELYEKGMILLTFVNFNKNFIKFYKYLVTGRIRIKKLKSGVNILGIPKPKAKRKDSP